jgi:hypothetical protein
MVCGTGPGLVDDQGLVTVTCPVNYLISVITFASYGTPTGTCGSYSYSSCNMASSMSVVTSACVGKNSCVLSSGVAQFGGDPCGGVYKGLKIQAVCAYIYMPTAAPTTRSPTKAPVVANLLHRYSFNDGTAGDSISGLNAGLYSGAYIANGQAVFTSSLNSYVLLPDILGTSASSSFSIEIWASTGAGTTGYPRIFHIAPSLVSGFSNALILYSDTNRLTVYFSVNGQSIRIDTTSAPFNYQTNLHVVLVMTFSGTSTRTLTLYVNGALVGTTSTTSTSMVPSSAGGGYLGKGSSSAAESLNGSIDEFRAWSIALSVAQIQANYKNGPNTIALV